jgi:hypothetical protein
MTKTAARHHKAASAHHEKAAEHHLMASKFYEGGQYEKAAHHAHIALGHAMHAQDQAKKATLHHTRQHDSSFPWDEWVE